MPDAWRPLQYEKFQRERSQPFHDLAALVRRLPGGRAVDLGCGTGELTRELLGTVGAASILGLDASEAMLARALPFARPPSVTFERAEIAARAEAWAQGGEAFDLVFSNAALHWVPDHPALFARLTGAVAPGGQLAVQMPANHDHATHAVAAAVAAEPPFAAVLAGDPVRPHVLAPEAYATLLHGLGYAEQHVRLVVYAHVLPAREAVLEWVKGTTLTAYEARLGAPLYAQFLARYAARLFEALPDDRPLFFPFKRVLLWARL